jgi:hypothetical protein
MHRWLYKFRTAQSGLEGLRLPSLFQACGLVPLAYGLIVSLSSPALAHDPIISCFDNKDGTITCEAGYSDGAPSAGQTIRVMMPNKRLILENKFGKDSSFTFKKPEGDFLVEFIGDVGHRAAFDSADIDN